MYIPTLATETRAKFVSLLAEANIHPDFLAEQVSLIWKRIKILRSRKYDLTNKLDRIQYFGLLEQHIILLKYVRYCTQNYTEDMTIEKWEWIKLLTDRKII